MAERELRIEPKKKKKKKKKTQATAVKYTF